MIGDVRREVGGHSVGAHQHAVLVVAVFRAAEPERLVLLVEVASLLQRPHGGRHEIAVVQRLLGEKVVERDAELAQFVLDLLEDAPGRVSFEERQRRFERLVEELFAPGVDHFLSDVVDVAPFVGLLGERELLGMAEQFEIARLRGTPEDVHLQAGVVDVVFLLHAPAREGEDVARHVADRGAAAVTDVQRPSGIGADELDLRFPTFAEIDAPVIAAGRQHVADDVAHPQIRQIEIDEAGTGHFDAADVLVRADAAHDVLGQVARFAAQQLAVLHGGVRRPVAVVLLFGALEMELAQRSGILPFFLCDRFKGSPNKSLQRTRVL